MSACTHISPCNGRETWFSFHKTSTFCCFLSGSIDNVVERTDEEGEEERENFQAVQTFSLLVVSAKTTARPPTDLYVDSSNLHIFQLLQCRMKPLLEVKEEPDGFLSLFDNNSELYEGKLVSIQIRVSNFSLNQEWPQVTHH